MKFGFLWGCSSVGRAPALQAGGQEFESLHLHESNEQSQNFWGTSDASLLAIDWSEQNFDCANARDEISTKCLWVSSDANCLYKYNYYYFLSFGLCLTWSVNNKSRTLKTEYRRILKLEKTSEGINVKLIFSNKCKHKEPKKAYNAMYASAG